MVRLERSAQSTSTTENETKQLFGLKYFGRHDVWSYATKSILRPWF